MFGENLHKILQAQKIPGKELSQLTGISQSTISKFLSGDQEPRYSQMISIAKAVQLPPDVFMSDIDSQIATEPPMINEFCMVREIYNDEHFHLHITSLYAFNEFTMEIPVVNDEDLYVVVVTEGKTVSKLGLLRAGDFRVTKGIDYKGLNVTMNKGTKIILFIMHESFDDNIKSLSRTFFDAVEQQKKNF